MSGRRSKWARDEPWPEDRKIGRLTVRISRKARRAHRHREVAAIAEDLRRQVYYRQNGVERLTPRQRRRIQHKANAGRG